MGEVLKVSTKAMVVVLGSFSLENVTVPQPPDRSKPERLPEAVRAMQPWNVALPRMFICPIPSISYDLQGKACN